tara:strand:- start:42 stop:527 length:486 start_codon:yes stop_codon:yes gene_type:complete
MTNNPFKLRSGNGVPFKRMGSSPVKQSIDPLDLGLIDEAKKVKVKKPVSKPYKFSTKKVPNIKDATSKKLTNIVLKGDKLPYDEITKKHAKQKADKLAKRKIAKRQAKKKVIKTVTKKALSRFVPYVGWGLLASDIVGTVKKMKSGHTFKQAVKSQVLGTD